MRDIFGVKCNFEVVYGLVDVILDFEFDIELKNYEIIWNEREIEDCKINDLFFYKWFLKEKVDIFKKYFLLLLRLFVGFGFVEYIIYVNEFINKKLKEKVDYKEF